MTYACLLASLMVVGGSRADVPPPYEVYDIGASLKDAEPFPAFASVTKGGPADKAGIKVGDGVIAIDGGFSKGSAPFYFLPFYFFARQLGGPQNSVVELVLLRDGHQVMTVKVKRTNHPK
jgi:C-terminal processing protease CtpA/Prc